MFELRSKNTAASKASKGSSKTIVCFACEIKKPECCASFCEAKSEHREVKLGDNCRQAIDRRGIPP
ncbi:MAG: hypothetical protein ACP5OX_02750, partial [Minisyncoccia bacterium]